MSLKKRRTRKSKVAGAAMNVATVAAGAVVGNVTVKVIKNTAPKIVHAITDAAIELGLEKSLEHGIEIVEKEIGDNK